jgi:drug/metabolite transporter (DMT)-like permease
MHRISGRWRLGFALALTTAVVWGLLPIALKIALAGLDPYTITWYRFAVAALVLGLLLAVTHRLPSPGSIGGNGWVLVAIAVGGLVGNYVLYVIALRYASPTINQTVIQLAPIFLLLGALVLFKERFSRWQWLGLAILIPGLALFFNRRLPELLQWNEGVGLGVALLVVAALVWAAYALVQKKLMNQLSAQQILFVLYLGGVPVLLPLSDPAAISTIDGMQLSVLAFCCANTLIGYSAFAAALEHWEVSRVGAVLSTAPLFTIAGMWLTTRWMPDSLLPPESLNGLSIAGALMVVAGSALCAFGEQAVREEAPAASP